MNGGSSSESLALFARFLSKTLGLHFRQERLGELEQKMALLGREQGYRSGGDYMTQLMAQPLSRLQRDLLARTLTIGETYFLRDPKSYRVLEERLLPELIAARRHAGRNLRIWSAGCSSGEEPYSIAILLTRLLRDHAEWDITLIGSDLNPQALDRARQGVYSRWSFRDAPAWLFDYFSRLEDGRYQIAPRIREMVQFGQLNLVDDAQPAAIGAMDIIFCRNVLLYFDAAQIERTMARFHRALVPNGWLFVGPTEINHQNYHGFSCRNFEGTLVLRKPAAGEPGAGRRPPAAPRVHPSPPAPAGCAALPATPPAAGFPAPAAAPQQPEPPGETAPLHSPGRKALAADQLSDRHAEAVALYQQGRYREAAEAALGSAPAEAHTEAALALAARAYANLGKLEEARECCEKAIARDRLTPQNHYLLSIILEQQGETAEAIQALKRALFLDHDYLLAYFALGNLYRQAGDRKESERHFGTALRLLERRHPHEVLEEAEGMTAGRLAELIRAVSRG